MTNQEKHEYEMAAREVPAWPADMKELIVQVFYNPGDPPFVFGIYGNPSSAIEEIENDMEENPEIFTHGAGEYLFRATYQPEQRSFPEYVDFQAYWETEEIGYRPIGKAMTEGE